MTKIFGNTFYTSNNYEIYVEFIITNNSKLFLDEINRLPTGLDKIGLTLYNDKKDYSKFVLFFYYYKEDEKIFETKSWHLWKTRWSLYMRQTVNTGFYKGVLYWVNQLSTESTTISPSVERTISLSSDDCFGDLNIHDGLVEFTDYIEKRYKNYKIHKNNLISFCDPIGKTMDAIMNWYKTFGLSETLYKDYIPGENIRAVYIEINGCRHELVRIPNDIWQGKVPYVNHLSSYKVIIKFNNDTESSRVSCWSRYVKTEENLGVYWNLNYNFQHQLQQKPQNLFIYEAHIGSSTPNLAISTYKQFTYEVLPLIQKMGYNAILLVALLEHNHYASFGKHTTNYFAISSRFGSPDEFMELVDVAHGLGMCVIVDVNHGYGSPAENIGLCAYNTESSQDGMFFKQGAPYHKFDAKLFNHSKYEVTCFLVGSIMNLINTYKIDGIRFTDILNMIYSNRNSSNTYNESDIDSMLYLMLINDILNKNNIISIADDSTTLPCVCVPINQGGLGFDYLFNSQQTIRYIEAAETIESLDLHKLTSYFESDRIKGRAISTVECYDNILKAKRPLKIAMCSWESLMTHAVGGVAPHVTEVAAGMARLGQEVHIYTRAVDCFDTVSVHHGVYYHECSFQLDPDFPNEMKNMCRSFVNAIKQTEDYMQEKFSILHCHDWLAAEAGMLLRGEGRMVIQTIHSTEFGRNGNKHYGGPSSRIHALENTACQLADRVICVSGVLAQEIQQLFGVHPNKIRVIYNGIHSNHFSSDVDVGAVKLSYGIATMDPLFLFVGRMVVQKGADLLVEAIPEILKTNSNAKFLIVGDGHMLESLKVRANHLNINSACRFAGKLTGDTLKAAYAACDAVVIPSRNEPFGIVVLESWASGKPVVATNWGGPRDFVSHDKDGYLVDPNPNSISWGCSKILSNFEHSRWLGEQGKLKAANSFSWDIVSVQTRDIYYEQLALSDATYSSLSRGGLSLASIILKSDIYFNMNAHYDCKYMFRKISFIRLCVFFSMTFKSNSYQNTMSSEFMQQGI